MIIGITGRGGTGKSSLAKTITKNYPDFYHIEVDKVIDNELKNGGLVLERAKKELHKEYTWDDVKQAYFKKDKLHAIFLEELNSLLIKMVEDNKEKNVVIEHFFLNNFDVYNRCDIKINLVADLEDRIQRVENRGNMTREEYLAVDNAVVQKSEIDADYTFNIKDYQSELVSIIIPIYNAMDYIEQTLKSVLSQTYNNFEVICINDGSTDKTLEILEKYQKLDSRIKVITTENKNVSNARNRGLEEAKGDYIAFVDSDDIIDNNFIATLYDTIKISGADFVNSSVSIDKDGIPLCVVLNESNHIIFDDPTKAFLKVKTPFAVWGKLFKKEVLKGIKFDDIPCFEDFGFMWEVAKQAIKSGVTNRTKYHYVQRQKESLTCSLYNENNVQIIKHAFKVLEEANYIDEAKQYFYACIFHNVLLYAKSLDNPIFKNNYKEEIFACLQYLEQYNDYRFQLLEYNQLNIEEVKEKVKNNIGQKCIAILWNSMNDQIPYALEDISKLALIEKVKTLSLSSSELDNFIDKLYPHKQVEYWKTQYKKDALVNKYDTNDITIVYLTCLNAQKNFDERKGVHLNSSVINIKNNLRNKYKNVIKDYQFDNVFHMTDDEEEYYKTAALIDEYFLGNRIRDNGFIMLDNLMLTERKNLGKRKKFVFNDYIFKETNNNFEAYSELFNEEALELINLKHAFYDIAIYNGKKGVITKDFVINNCFISGYDLLNNNVTSNNIKEIMKYNNLEFIYQIIFNYIKNNNLKGDFDTISKNLYKLFIYDLATLQGDRNPNNWGILIKNGYCEFAHVFDNSNMANCNHPEKDSFDIQVLLGYGYDSSQNIYDIVLTNSIILNDVINLVEFLITNLEYIFSRINIKTGVKVPLKFVEKVYNLLEQHLSNLKSLNSNINNDYPRKLKM